MINIVKSGTITLKDGSIADICWCFICERDLTQEYYDHLDKINKLKLNQSHAQFSCKECHTWYDFEDTGFPKFFRFVKMVKIDINYYFVEWWFEQSNLEFTCKYETLDISVNPIRLDKFSNNNFNPKVSIKKIIKEIKRIEKLKAFQ